MFKVKYKYKLEKPETVTVYAVHEVDNGRIEFLVYM